MPHRYLFAILSLVPLAAHPAGTLDWSLCGTPENPEPPALESDLESLHLSADLADIDLGGAALLRGNVEAQSGYSQLQAESMLYDRGQNVIDVANGIRYWDQGLYLSGAAGHFDLAHRDNWLEDVSYRLIDEHGRGHAEHVSFGPSKVLLLENSTYTTCMPGNEDWAFHADSIELDGKESVGEARNVTVRFKDVPIFYSPYLNFPLSDRRKTGFLLPSYGSSEDTGVELTVPYYWNIAPDKDATFAVRAMSKRGAMLQGEFRYLLAAGEGQIGVEYLPDDRQYNGDRALYSFQHLQTFARAWTLDVDLNHVTDRDYFQDLGTDLSISGRQFLNRRADLRYDIDDWTALARVQTYQTIDETIAELDRPYQRLPQLLLSRRATSRNFSINTGLEAEYVQFDRRSGVTGRRVDLNPVISYPMRGPGAFVVPALDLRYTHYDLDNQLPGRDDRISRGTSILSVDSGLIFERDTSWRGQGLLQTLEPRLYYLYSPYHDQSDIPDFDTGEYTFSFAQLFRNNRFSGADRIADANQATLALTSRWIDRRDGHELVRASLGQIRYFRDRRVNLPGVAVARDNDSDLVAEVAAQVARHWHTRAGIQWDNDTHTTQRGTFVARYQPDDTRVLNLGYRRVRGNFEQADISTRWPLNRRVNFVGRWNYELPDSRILDSFAGLEYDSCCWSLRAVVRHYLRANTTDHDTGIYLQLELKGLGGVGRETEALLRDQIPGYRNDF